ncbi:hypothetical protein WICPIJ_006121 [Wickerhamomyces pijperi]|uniref:Uncharacterized protein n=1 Tax=Wickerhamomyces pijperi TaxID=599730 RepID=A0A9P8TL61_WICPI|nr:hypothetical protein WICPIJ_006121 [Wickerhamomyces pijperi]
MDSVVFGYSVDNLETLPTKSEVRLGCLVFVNNNFKLGKFLILVLMEGMDDWVLWNITAPPCVATALSIPEGLPWIHFSPMKDQASMNSESSPSVERSSLVKVAAET